MNDSVKFIPETFSKISLGYDKQEQNICTPSFVNGSAPINSIVINVPDKIIAETRKNLLVPICYTGCITQRRILKYFKEKGYTIHMRKIEAKQVYSGIVVKEVDPYEIPDPFQDGPETIKRLQEEVEKARHLSEEELNRGSGTIDYMNVDALQYVDIPMESGKYEIYITASGLESNHRIVEIEIKK